MQSLHIIFNTLIMKRFLIKEHSICKFLGLIDFPMFMHDKIYIEINRFSHIFNVGDFITFSLKDHTAKTNIDCESLYEYKVCEYDDYSYELSLENKVAQF